MKVKISTMSIIIPIDIFSWLISANLESKTVNNPTNPIMSRWITIFDKLQKEIWNMIKNTNESNMYTEKYKIWIAKFEILLTCTISSIFSLRSRIYWRNNISVATLPNNVINNKLVISGNCNDNWSSLIKSPDPMVIKSKYPTFFKCSVWIVQFWSKMKIQLLDRYPDGFWAWL